jgi:hypothetical protein
MRYDEFLRGKAQLCEPVGFDPVWVPDFLFDFQRSIVEWSTRQGRSAIFADCGMGKTPMQLVWAENVIRKTGGRVLIVTPLAVGAQTVREADKFGIECARSHNGSNAGPLTVTNYERLHLFNPEDYAGVVCDESSAIKNFDGKRRAIVVEFLRTRPYRLLCTATAAPNDYIELGNTSEALGVMGHMDMLGRFFRNDQNNSDTKRRYANVGGGNPKWRFKKHAEQPFWRWVCSWARAIRKPSDLGFDDGRFILPDLIERETVVQTEKTLPGELFARPARSLAEQRQERRMTLAERCDMVADIVNGSADPFVVWCHMNDEGKTLAKLIPDAVEVTGSDTDERKEQSFLDFSDGNTRVLVTKPRIGAFGLNWQHCHRVTFFPSHSFEQYYQGVRRCWRFGQTNAVEVDIITTEGEVGVLENLKRKASAADQMFTELVAHMNDPLLLDRGNPFTERAEVPAWMS